MPPQLDSLLGLPGSSGVLVLTTATPKKTGYELKRPGAALQVVLHLAFDSSGANLSGAVADATSNLLFCRGDWAAQQHRQRLNSRSGTADCYLVSTSNRSKVVARDR